MSLVGTVTPIGMVDGMDRCWERGEAPGRASNSTFAGTFTGLVTGCDDRFATVLTGEAPYYLSLTEMGYDHRTVKYSTDEHVNGMTQTNVMESFWATITRGYHGVRRQVSYEHLHGYMEELIP